MKKILLVILIIFSCAFSTNSHSDKVYVVMSEYAKVYHRTRDCRGLQNAKYNIAEVTIEEAVKMGRRPCKICNPPLPSADNNTPNE